MNASVLREEYVFKNSFVFMESGNLKMDLCRAMKDEIGYMCERKHAIYFNEYCEMQEDNQFYGDVADILNKIKNVMLDPTITSLKEYFEYYKFQVNIGLISKKEEKNMSLPLICLRQFDDHITNLAYDIVASTHKNDFVTKYGVFSIIRQYFEIEENKKYTNFYEFLDKIYSIIFQTIKLKYGDENGKKL